MKTTINKNTLLNTLIGITTAILICLFFTGCAGCSDSNTFNIAKTPSETSSFYISLKQINGYLYYDTDTKIVYVWNGSLNYSQCSTTPSAYYAENGKPYRFNTYTGCLEMID